MLNPNSTDYCYIPEHEPPKLVIVIDTEEEFNWSGGFSKDNTSVKSMRWISRVQKIFDEYEITPSYVIDYPVASKPDGYSPLLEIYQAGRCLIGAHLHPWVNPPFEELVNRHNTFAGNLPRNLEKMKLRQLGECVEEKFGAAPVLFKAGRYGIGPHTADILEELGYEVDLSVCPHMDYSQEGGPNFTSYSAWPYWFGRKRRLLELPLTVGYTGLFKQCGSSLYKFASRPLLAKWKSIGILSRLHLLDKIWLSPEGYEFSEHMKLVRTLHREGLRIFSFAFHSPSVEPGHTPYVSSTSDLDQFLDRCRRFFDFFMGELGGIPSDPVAIKQQVSNFELCMEGQ